MRKLLAVRIGLLLLVLAATTKSGVASGFAPPVIYQAGAQPSSIASADFNGDGIADLAVSNQLSNNVSVLLGNGDGTFQPAVNYAVGQAPVAILASAAFSGLNPPQFLVVANSGDNTVSVLISNGDGTFQPAVNYSVGTGVSPQAVLCFPTNSGSLNWDLVVANRAGGTSNNGNIAVLFGNGDGTFQPALNYDVLGSQPVALAAGAFNQSLYPDLAVADFGSNDVTILQNDCAGHFTASTTYPVGIAPSGIMWIYVRGELLVTNSGSNDITILSSVPGGGFGFPRSFPVGTSPTAITIGIFNQSQYLLDIAVANQGDSTISVFLGKELKPYIRKPAVFPTCSSPKFLLASDIRTSYNRDDLMVACSNGVGVMLNTTP